MQLYTSLFFIKGIGEKNSDYYWGYFKDYGENTSVSAVFITTESQPVSYGIEAPSLLVPYQKNGTFSADNDTIITLPGDVITSSQGVHASIKSERVTLIGQTVSSFGSDTFLVLPTTTTTECKNQLEYVYYGISVAINKSSVANIVLIVGTENDTEMKLMVPQSVNISVDNVTTKLIPDREYSFIVNRLQTIYIESFQDLTGTKIVTNKEVSVFIGQTRNVPRDSHFTDHSIEQIPSTEFWGSRFYIVPLGVKSYSIKVLAAYNSTDVTIYCNNHTIQSFVISEREYINKTLLGQEYCILYATRNVLVVQFSNAQNNSFASNTSGVSVMVLVPATNQYMNQLDFSTIRYSDNYTHYINIIVMEQYFQPYMIYLRAGGVDVSLNIEDWVPIVFVNITVAYTIQVTVPEGTVQITHENSTALLTAIVYGFNAHRGYGHLGGLSLTKTGYFVLNAYVYVCIQYTHDYLMIVSLSQYDK